MRYPRVMLRVVVAASVLGLFSVSAALAAPPPSPTASATATAQPSRSDGGVIEGRVTNVDYARGVVTVESTQGRVDVTTMPTTSVQSDDPGYHTLTDVSKGSRVRIFISKTAGKVIAQIIKLVKH
jgi:hypothetical protein